MMCDKSTLESICLGEEECVSGCVCVCACMASGTEWCLTIYYDKLLICLLTIFLKNKPNKTEWSISSKRNSGWRIYTSIKVIEWSGKGLGGDAQHGQAGLWIIEGKIYRARRDGPAFVSTDVASHQLLLQNHDKLSIKWNIFLKLWTLVRKRIYNIYCIYFSDYMFILQPTSSPAVHAVRKAFLSLFLNLP